MYCKKEKQFLSILLIKFDNSTSQSFLLNLYAHSRIVNLRTVEFLTLIHQKVLIPFNSSDKPVIKPENNP